MAFVNEIVSEEDIKEYGLDELMREFSPWPWREGRPVTFVHAWTIDRERDIYFVLVKSVEEVGQSGRPQPTPKKVCILGWHGKRVRLTIDRAKGSSVMVNEVPFRIVWDLVDLDASQLPDVSRSELVQVLKEALTTYGQMGVHYQVPNTVVEFTF